MAHENRFLRCFLCVAFLLTLSVGPVALVSCGGGGDGGEETEVSSSRRKTGTKKATSSRGKRSRKKKSSASKKPAPIPDESGDSELAVEVADLLKEARASGAARAFASAYRKAKKYYDDGRDYEAEGDMKKAASRLKRAKRALTTVLGDHSERQKVLTEYQELAKQAETAKEKALKAGADKLAAVDYEDALDILQEAQQARTDDASARDLKKATEDLETAMVLFEDSITRAAENKSQQKLALAEVEALQRYKEQAKAKGADTKALTDWMQAERNERAAHADLEAGRFQAAIHAFQQAATSYIRALENTLGEEEMREFMAKNEAATKAYLEQQRQLEMRRIEADRESREAEAKARELAAKHRTEAARFAPRGGTLEETQAAFMAHTLRTLAQTFEAEVYPQELDPEDEDLLRDNYKKLASNLQYDADSGVAFLDYTSGRTLRADFGKLTTSLLNNRYIQFIDRQYEDSDDMMSFAANTRGTFLIPIPFKYRVRVEWDMSIQTMDANGKFNCIAMYDDRKNNHYLTDWIHWGSSTRGGRPKWVQMYPDKKFLKSANLWFDKTRDIGMVVEFKMPGDDIASDEPTLDELTSSATMSCTYDADLDAVTNTFVSRNPISSRGYVGFKWYRTKFQVKKLKISGILDKEGAVAQLKKIMGIRATKKKATASKKKAPEPKLESLLAPKKQKKDEGEPDFDF